MAYQITGILDTALDDLFASFLQENHHSRVFRPVTITLESALGIALQAFEFIVDEDEINCTEEVVQLNFGQYGSADKQVISIPDVRVCNETNMQRDENRKPPNYIKGKKRNINIIKLVPHPNTDKIDKSKNYIGVVVYNKRGKCPRGEGIAEFGFKDSAKLTQKTANTMHLRAYYALYNELPSDGDKLVASGCSYQAQRQAYVFNSATFNQTTGNQYQDPDFYVDKAIRVVGQTEQKMLLDTFNKWEN